MPRLPIFLCPSAAALLVVAVWAHARPQGMQNLTATELLPLEPRTALFEYLEGANEAEQVKYTLARAPNEQGVWEIKVGDERSTFVRQDSDGAIVILRELIRSKDQRIQYASPLVLLPATVRAGDAVENKTTARIYSIKDGTLKYTGTCKHRVAMGGKVRIRTPDGIVEAYLVKVDHDIELDMGSVEIEIRNAYQVGRGRVYQHLETTVTRLVFPETTIETTRIVKELD